MPTNLPQIFFKKLKIKIKPETLSPLSGLQPAFQRYLPEFTVTENSWMIDLLEIVKENNLQVSVPEKKHLDLQNDSFFKQYFFTTS